MNIIYEYIFAIIIALNGITVNNGLSEIDNYSKRISQLIVDFNTNRIINKLFYFSDQIKRSP
jgi:hypothetical protein